MHDGQSFLFECLQSLLNCIWIIVSSAACLGALHNPVNKNLGGALEVYKISYYNLISKLLLELIPVLLITRKSIKQVPSVAVCLDSFFEQLDHQLTRQQFTFLHVRINLLCEVSTLLLLFPEQIASRKMLEFVVSDEVLCLCAFTATWSSE